MKIDSQYKPELCKAEDLKKIKDISTWMDRHWVATLYSISMQMCDDESCCGKFRSPEEDGIRSLVMQRQPTQRIDPSRPGHFLSRKDALQLHGGDAKSLTDLSDLPSMNNEVKKASAAKKARDARDIAVSKALCLKSWDPKKVKEMVRC